MIESGKSDPENATAVEDTTPNTVTLYVCANASFEKKNKKKRSSRAPTFLIIFTDKSLECSNDVLPEDDKDCKDNNNDCYLDNWYDPERCRCRQRTAFTATGIV